MAAGLKQHETRRDTGLAQLAEHSDLVVPEIRTTPSFVNVRVGGREQIAASLFRYTLDVEVAGDAPITHCVGPSAGKIVLKTNHPDAPELRLAIDFAVLEKP